MRAMISASEKPSRKFLIETEEDANCRELSALNTRLPYYPIFQLASSGKQFAWPVTSCSHLAAYLHKHTTCKLLCQPVSKPVVVAPQQCQCIDARPDMHKTSWASLHERWESSAEARNWQSFLDQPAEENPPSPLRTSIPHQLYPRAPGTSSRVAAGISPGHVPILLRCDSACLRVPLLSFGAAESIPSPRWWKECRCPGLGCPVIVTHTSRYGPFDERLSWCLSWKTESGVSNFGIEDSNIEYGNWK